MCVRARHKGGSGAAINTNNPSLSSCSVKILFIVSLNNSEVQIQTPPSLTQNDELNPSPETKLKIPSSGRAAKLQ